MKFSLAVIFGLLAICHASWADSRTETVEQFVAAYNQRNVDTMLNLVNEDMHWMSITGTNISVETASRSDLRAAMTGYFESMPDATSHIRSVSASGDFVYTLEEASWTVNGIKKSQCSLAVYELTALKIQHVWYFPSHRCDQTKSD